MPTPPPDPTGRPSTAKRAPDGTVLPETSATPPEVISNASTNSHHPTSSSADPQASDFILQQPAPQLPIGSDILRVLTDPAANPNLEVLENTDDSPTVITRGIGDQPPPPMPLKVLASDPPQLAGRQLGGYELIESVGTGGMATVLKARDLELGRIVALKILPPTAARDSESVTRFKHEARAAAMLDHENIARVYACGEDQGLHFIAFEFVEGVNLRQMIERRGPLPAGEAVGYMIQIAAGLAHAAERGVVHRDIKPSNILITPDRRAKIVDMGLARQLEAPANGGVTQSGVTLGTFDYISPEQALDPRRTDVRSDIYSLGCTFYHVLTGRPPVPEGTAAKKLHAHQHTNPLDPRQIRGDIPDELVVILARMMAKNPDQRYQTPAELIAHLKALAERLKLLPDVVAQDSVIRSVRAESSLRPPQLHLGWVVAVAAVLVAIAVFVLSNGDPAAVSTPPWANDTKQAKSDTFRPSGSAGKTNPAVPIDDGIVSKAEQLAAKIAQASPEGVTKIRLAPGVYDLTQLPNPVVFRGAELELTGSVYPPTILKVHPTPTSVLAATPAGAFAVIGADAVSITGVRFETATPMDEELTEGPSATFVAAAVGSLTLTDCVFPTPEAIGVDGVGAVSVTRSGSTVRAERCLFASATFGLWVPDSCKLTVHDCGFGPHDTAIRVGEARATPLPIETSIQEAEIAIQRSSFLLNATSAVVANLAGGDGPGVKVTADYCVFSTSLRLDPLAAFPGVAAFFRQPLQPVILRTRTHPGEIQYTGGQKNAYYGVAALAVVSEAGTTYTFEQCKEKEFKIADATAVTLSQPPWSERNPLRVLADRTDPWRAFGLKLTEPMIFAPDKQVRLIGAQFHDDKNFLLARRAYPDPNLIWPPDPPKSPVSPSRSNVLVWYPDAKDNPLSPNTYTDLAVLLKAARPGDEILIRHNGLLPLERTIELEKLRIMGAGEFRVTFKPDRGYTPILAAPGFDKLDQTLFRLMNGKVTFQGVQFLLKPSRPRDGQTVTAIEIVGGESCVFEDCVFTLAEEDASKANAVLVPDPKQVMAMEGSSSPTPRVKFERCVIRGKGRGVWVKASRSVEVAMVQTLTAIEGPLFLAEPGGKMAPGARSLLHLNRVTAFVGGPLVEMRGSRVGEMRVSGLLPLDVHADECLFAAVPGAGRPLVELDGLDPDDAMRIIPWQVQVANRYANFDESATVMVVRPGSDGTMPKDWNWNQWITFASEPAAGAGKRLGKVAFENAPASLASLAAFKPADAAVKSIDFPDVTGSKPIDVGAAIEKLPLPTTPE